MIQGFKQFIVKGNVIDLAVAVIIGAAFGAVVSAFVKDLLTPLIAAIGGKPDFSSLYFTVNSSRFMYGEFLNSITSFLIVAATIYFVVIVPVSRITALTKSAEVPTTKKCPECLSDVPLQARRCAHCAEEIGPVSSVKVG
ncbi:MAG: large conductance mechanosensitive channel protein MscL [Bdellovibrionota bacterium]